MAVPGETDGVARLPWMGRQGDSRLWLVPWCVTAMSLALLMLQVRGSPLYGGDFLPVWTAARSFVRGGSDYTLYAYPPGGLLGLAPLGLLPFQVARFTWCVVQAILVVGASVAMHSPRSRAR